MKNIKSFQEMANENFLNTKKRTMERLHNWDKDDTIITLYFVKYGTKGLPVKDDKDLAEGVIGSTKASLHMQAANVRYVLGYDEGVLDCFSDIQKKVVDEYSTKTFEELKDIVIDIITRSDISGNIDKVRANQKLKEDIKKRKQKEADEKAAMDAMWRRMGKDTTKMKFLKRQQ